jgi:Uma2 family endonuclease
MSIGTLKRKRVFGPRSTGTLMTPKEFDAAEFEEGWRYELIHGVLIVSPSPLENERDPNGQLEHWLRTYQESHPKGYLLEATVSEQTLRTNGNRRRADRVLWIGLGRMPRKGETPTVVVEFVSAGRRDRKRDYEEKRDEYRAMGIREYWIIDRFNRCMTVYRFDSGKTKARILKENQVFTTELLPGFEFSLAALFKFADRWPDVPETEFP